VSWDIPYPCLHSAGFSSNVVSRSVVCLDAFGVRATSIILHISCYTGKHGRCQLNDEGVWGLFGRGPLVEFGSGCVAVSFTRRRVMAEKQLVNKAVRGAANRFLEKAAA
jgi:hypothetical protein